MTQPNPPKTLSEHAQLPKRQDWPGRLEVIAIGALAVFLVACHFRVWDSAGALWRDEVHSMNLASATTLGELWSHLWLESFPGLFPLVLRGWTLMVSADNDTGIRVLGLLMGLGICAALWANARLAGRSLPWLSLALFGFNAVTLRYGDSIRGYGLGIFLMLLAFNCFWRVTVNANVRNMVLAVIFALLCAHTLYQNAFVIAAFCAGGMAVAMRNRDWRHVGLLLSIGVVTALSLAVYLPVMARMAETKSLNQAETNRAFLWPSLAEALGGGGIISLIGWVVLPVGALVLAAVAQVRRSGLLTRRERDLLLFGGTATLTGLAGFWIFMRILNFLPQSWYYLLPMALVACFLDLTAGLFFRSFKTRVARLALVLLFCVSAAGPVWKSTRVRHTNVDSIAAYLEKAAGNQDLIVMDPWYCGVVFQRYYHGGAPWESVPPLADHSRQRSDLLKAQMASTNPLGPLLERISQTLQSGHRVWCVGGSIFLPPGQSPDPLPPAPQGVSGWYSGPYLENWSTQVGYHLQTRAQQILEAKLPDAGPVVRLENLPLLVAQGWRGE